MDRIHNLTTLKCPQLSIKNSALQTLSYKRCLDYTGDVAVVYGCTVYVIQQQQQQLEHPAVQTRRTTTTTRKHNMRYLDKCSLFITLLALARHPVDEDVLEGVDLAGEPGHLVRQSLGDDGAGALEAGLLSTLSLLTQRQQGREEVGGGDHAATLHPLHPVVDVLGGLPLDHRHLVEGEQAVYRLLFINRRLEPQLVG